jgi:lysylphosphatidylglycerol synthetase-like protein (DUF2156 family)
VKVQIEDTKMPPSTNTDERDLIVKYVRRWGNSTSDAALDPGCNIFITPNVKGFISYKVGYKCAVAYGDPICAPNDKPKLSNAFHDFCKNEGLSIVYAITSEKFSKWAIKNVCNTLVEFGEELIIDPANHDPKKGPQGGLVRKKIKRAIQEGTTVHEYLEHDAKLEKDIEEVGSAWLNARKGPQVYIAPVRIFDDRLGKRWFYAKKGDRIIGVLLLDEVQIHSGWLFSSVMMTPDAPNGTPELLVTTAIESLKNENCNYATFGAVPGKQLKEIIGLSKIYTWLVRTVYSAVRRIFRLDGKKIFWGKFQPTSQSTFLLFSEPKIGLNEIRSLMKALNVNLK